MHVEELEGEASRDAALGSLSSAVTYVGMMADRVLGGGDGSSWLDQLGNCENLDGWTVQDVDKAAMLVRALGERVRDIRAVVGRPGAARPFEPPQPSLGGSASPPDRLPLNRKERFYTGTVLPMVVASDGFLHLPRFLRLCGLDLVPVGEWHQEGTVVSFPGWVQFFSEYSFAESVFTDQDRARFEGRPQHADTPDIVLQGQDWLVAVEAKMFHRPSTADLNEQMDRQRVLVDYWTRTFGLPRERVAHVLLMPEGLRRDRRGVNGPVITWEQVADEFTGIAPAHWLAVLRQAVDGYSDLASTESDVSDARLTGQVIVEGHQDGILGYAAMGRRGGLNGQELARDLTEGTWRTQIYQVRIPQVPPNSNWFTIRDFVDRTLAVSTPAPLPDPPPPVEPVVLRDADGMYVTASRTPEGAILIQGQDLGLGGGIAEYEYALTITPDDVPALVAALGGAPTDDPLDLMAGRATGLVNEGVESWLRRHDVPYGFWSRAEHDD